MHNLFHTYSILCQSSCEGGWYSDVPDTIGYTANSFNRSTLGEQALSDIHRTPGVICTDSNIQYQYLHVDNQLTDQLINPVVHPYAQSNVQESQCGFNDYMWQEYNAGSYCSNDNLAQEGDVNFQTILDSICVFDGGSSSAGTLFYHSVDFINICNETDYRLQQLMYIHPTPGSVCAGFYHFHYDNLSVIRLNECCQVPSGQMNVMGSGSIPVHMICGYKNVDELSCNPKVAHANYLQDCLTFERHGISYGEYMYKIIDKLIDNVNDDMQTKQHVELVSPLLYCSDASVEYHDSCPMPNGIGGHLHDNNLDPDLSVSHDFDIIDKTRGFFNHSSGHFSFIGPDRDLVTISTIPQCFDIAKIIRDTGLPNYMQARIPLSSGLNLQAWEYRLRDYPDKFLFQYLKFEFPLSLSNPTSPHNVDIRNHPSALAYPKAVDQYITKEVGLGAMLGPCDHRDFDHYHCSPLLTHPKDTDKRRVILNLSYPYGAFLNDGVSKSHFDGRRFTLKFPLIDDIVQDILETEDPVIFKVDVARAFQNLRVDPADTVKLGMSTLILTSRSAGCTAVLHFTWPQTPLFSS